MSWHEVSAGLRSFLSRLDRVPRRWQHRLGPRRFMLVCAAAGVLLVGACGGLFVLTRRPAADDNLTKDAVRRRAFIGTWVEDPSPRRVRASTHTTISRTARRRRLTLSPDHTFRMTVCDPHGKPVDPPQFAAGQWWISGGDLVLKTKESTLHGPTAGWAPHRFLGLQVDSDGAGHDQFEIRGRDGIRVRYGRAQPMTGSAHE